MPTATDPTSAVPRRIVRNGQLILMGEGSAWKAESLVPTTWAFAKTPVGAEDEVEIVMREVKGGIPEGGSKVTSTPSGKPTESRKTL